jgi:hypothetical protein
MILVLTTTLIALATFAVSRRARVR